MELLTAELERPVQVVTAQWKYALPWEKKKFAQIAMVTGEATCAGRLTHWEEGIQFEDIGECYICGKGEGGSWMMGFYIYCVECLYKGDQMGYYHQHCEDSYKFDEDLGECGETVECETCEGTGKVDKECYIHSMTGMHYVCGTCGEFGSTNYHP